MKCWYGLVVAGLVMAGCAAGSDGAEPLDSGAAATVTVANTAAVATSEDPLAVASIEGRFAVSADGHELAIICWGDGVPVVVLDAGTGDAGIDRWKSTALTRSLAADIRVCAYDRAGLGASDPAPDHPRTLDEVVDDLHLLLAAADVETPVVLVGASGGGFDVYQHAGRYPDDVAGVVLLDVPAGQANIATSDVPAWDSIENPEHMDYVEVEHQMAVDRLAIRAIPVTVVTASHGQSTEPAEQAVWLDGSSRPVQVILEGGHNIYDDDPDAVLTEILAVLSAVRAEN